MHGYSRIAHRKIVKTEARQRFPGGTVVKNLPANAGDARDTGLIPEWERSHGEGNGHPLQCSYLENSMDREAWQATVHEVAKSRTQLSAFWLTQWLSGKKKKICLIRRR